MNWYTLSLSVIYSIGWMLIIQINYYIQYSTFSSLLVKEKYSRSEILIKSQTSVRKTSPFDSKVKFKDNVGYFSDNILRFEKINLNEIQNFF